MTALLIHKQIPRRHPRFFRARARAHAQSPCDGSLADAKWRNGQVGLKICHGGAFPLISDSIHPSIRYPRAAIRGIARG